MRSLLAGVFVAAVATGLVAQKDDPKKEGEPIPEGRLSIALDPGMHTGPMVRVFFREGGKQLVTLGDDHAVRLWDLDDGKTIKGIKVIYLPGFSRENGLRAAALTKDGKRLAVAALHRDKGKETPVIYVLSLPDGEIEHTLTRGDKSARAATTLAFSPDGKTLASSSHIHPDGGIRLWSLAEKKSAPRVIAPKNRERTNALAFSPDGKSLAWVNNEQGGIVDVGTGKGDAPISGGRLVAWSPDGKAIASAERNLRLHDETGQLLPASAKPQRGTHSLAFGPDANTVLWNDSVIDVGTGKVSPFAGRPRLSTSFDATISQDGNLVASVGMTMLMSNYILVRDARSGVIRSEMIGVPWFSGGSAYVIGRWSADGKAVGWRPHVYATGKHPPENRFGTFHLSDLKIGTTMSKEEGSPGRRLELGDLTLKPHNKFHVGYDLVKAGKTIVTLPNAFATFVGKDRIAAITHHTTYGISLFDAQTGKPIRQIPTRRILNNTLIPSPDGRYLLTLHNNQTLCIWNMEEDQPLFTMHKNGNDWIIWTKEGYYAASPGGDRMVGWKVDNGIGAMPSHYPADRFDKRMRRPEVIAKAFELGSVQKALAALDGKDAKPAELEKLLPPAGSLRVLKQDGAAVTVEATAEARTKGQPVVALRLMLDGRPFPDVEAEEFEPGKAKASKQWTVQVPEGVHRLHVLARSEDASAHSEPVTVRHLVAANRPTLHLLAIGIDDYANGIPKLKCAVNDATQIAKAFPVVKEGNLFKDCKVYPLTDKDATLKKITARLDQLSKDAEREDVVVVFFAGHGAREGREFYLLTAESDTKQLDDKTALSGKALSRHLGKMRCQVLLLLDACHSGAVADRFRGGSDEAARQVADDEVGAVVLAAAQGHQEALEKDGNGYFTAAIKEALAGESRVPRNGRDGRLYIHNLYSHVMDVVGERSDFKQTPFLKAPTRVQPFAIRQFDSKK